MRSDLEDNVARGLTLQTPLRMLVNSQTLTGETALAVDCAPLQFLDPDGAKTVTLPLETSSKGQMIFIINKAGGAEDITVEDSTSATLVGTISQNEMALFVCNGVVWSMIIGKTT